jgi:DNA recombination protein Rad52
MLDWDGIATELRKPLDAKHVRPPPQGKYGEYVEGWHVIAEANRIFGFAGWSYSLDTLVKTNQAEKNGKHYVGYAATVTVTVDTVSRTDVGHGQGQMGNEGDSHDSAIKEAVTDALKRALRTFGNQFGLALYDKTKANVVDGSQLKLDEAIAGDKEAIGMVESMEELQVTWKTLNETWKVQHNCLPPKALVDAKDARKSEIQENAA